jgi:chromosomal replication initiation ATPase DnaA
LPQQLTLRFDPRQHRTRDDFHVGDANRAAIEAIDRWPDWPSRVVLVVGPEASGKSHLAAIAAAMADVPVYNAASIDWHGIASGLAAQQPDRLVIVEDAGAGIDEAGLFHLINAIMSANGWLLLTARQMPGEWRLTLPDLASRLRAATPIVIGAPDDALLESIIAKDFADRQTVVDPAVIRYSLPRMERSYAAALDLVVRLDAAAFARKSAITRALAADILSGTERHPSIANDEDDLPQAGADDDDPGNAKPS